MKKLIGGDAHEEVIEVESIKDLSESEQMERIADKFASVSNLYEPLCLLPRRYSCDQWVWCSWGIEEFKCLQIYEENW